MVKSMGGLTMRLLSHNVLWMVLCVGRNDQYVSNPTTTTQHN